jgi:hypothetical protein
MTREIDLGELTRDGTVHNLSGHERGVAAREYFHLDELEASDEDIRVVVPLDVYTLTPSFFQGMFARSVRALGGDRERFLARFRFKAAPVVLRQVDRGIEATRIRRDDLLVA